MIGECVVVRHTNLYFYLYLIEVPPDVLTERRLLASGFAMPAYGNTDTSTLTLHRSFVRRLYQ